MLLDLRSLFETVGGGGGGLGGGLLLDLRSLVEGAGGQTFTLAITAVTGRVKPMILND